MKSRFVSALLAVALVLGAGSAVAAAEPSPTPSPYVPQLDPPATPPLTDYAFDGAIVDDSGCYQNYLYQGTLGGAHIDLPFTMRVGQSDEQSLWVNASGALTFMDYPGHPYGQNLEDSTDQWSMPIIAPLMGQNSVWDYTPDGSSYTPAYYGFTQYDGHTALCATWLEVSPHHALSAPYISNTYVDPHGTVT